MKWNEMMIMLSSSLLTNLLVWQFSFVIRCRWAKLLFAFYIQGWQQILADIQRPDGESQKFSRTLIVSTGRELTNLKQNYLLSLFLSSIFLVNVRICNSFTERMSVTPYNLERECKGFEFSSTFHSETLKDLQCSNSLLSFNGLLMLNVE